MSQTCMNAKVTRRQNQLEAWDIMEHHDDCSGASTGRGKLGPRLAVKAAMVCTLLCLMFFACVIYVGRELGVVGGIVARYEDFERNPRLGKYHGVLPLTATDIEYFAFRDGCQLDVSFKIDEGAFLEWSKANGWDVKPGPVVCGEGYRSDGTCRELETFGGYAYDKREFSEKQGRLARVRVAYDPKGEAFLRYQPVTEATENSNSD